MNQKNQKRMILEATAPICKWKIGIRARDKLGAGYVFVSWIVLL